MNFNPPSRCGLATFVFRTTQIVSTLTVLVVVGSPMRAMAADGLPLHAHITTNRGCLESGDNATFAIGESIALTLGVDSSSVGQVRATLFVVKPSGSVRIFGLGSLSTNQNYLLGAHIGPPGGIHELLLTAIGGRAVSAGTCSFNVVGVSATPTPRPTSMATPSRTPTPTQPPTTPGALQPRITTDRGCNETGENPIFHVGEGINVSFEIDSNVKTSANATLFDILGNGFVNAINFGNVPTNRSLSFQARVAPPLGTEMLRLRASALGVSSATAMCSFSVAPALGNLPTRTATSTPIPTRTPSPTATATP